MQIKTFDIEGPLLITPARFGDARGWFSEFYSASKLADQGFQAGFVQDNLSFSAEAGTLRGLHYQAPPEAQGKLVGVMTGAVLDIAVDIRPGSKTYGRHVRAELSEANGAQLFVPEGFLHGFVTRAPQTRVFYKVTRAYSSAHDRSIAWNDPDLSIDWGVDSPVLSQKDRDAPRLSEIDPPFGEGGW